MILCKNLSKSSYDVNLFYCEFLRMFEKHALIALSSNSLDDCSSLRFDGLWKSEGVFRLISVEFSAMFFLLILSAIMVAIITKM